jgi:hypothetical protein
VTCLAGCSASRFHTTTTRPAAGVPTTTKAVVPTTLSPDVSVPWPSLVYGGPDVAVVGISPLGDGYEGTRPPQLYISTNLAHWTNVTPPQSQIGQFATFGFFEHASFLNPSTGWVTTWNPATTDVTIYRTSDGGRSWSTVPGGEHGENAGSTVLISLVNATTAFRETIEPTGPEMTLQVTTDAGHAWQTAYGGPPSNSNGGLEQGPFEMPMVFTDAERGFAALGVPPPLGVRSAPDFFMTSDGGSTWTAESPPKPDMTEACSGQENGPDVACLFGLPTFNNNGDGVLPAVGVTGAQAAVAFDVTEDGGVTWTLHSQRPVTVSPYDIQSRGGNLIGYPLVSVASASTWWLLGWTSTEITTQVSTDSGTRWVQVDAPPLVGTPIGLEALSATNALLAVQNVTPGGATTELLVTTDGGRIWSPCSIAG